MHKLHKVVLDMLQQRWAYKCSKGLFEKLFELGEIRGLADVIIQKESFDERLARCSGETLNRWRYDESGLHLLSKDVDLKGERVDYCYYCIDRQRNIMVVEWSTIFPGASTRKHLHYVGRGAVYEILEEDGEEVFKVIRIWME